MLEFSVAGLNELRQKLDFAVDFINEKTDLDEDAIFNYRLILCELISNVIQHGKSPCKIKIEILVNSIIINVSGGDGFKQNIYLPENDKERGRGLLLVENLCNDLKFIDNGKVVEVKLAF